ncbi:MAG: methyltransferase domain-containing protein, partial [Campylobacterales bacterium]|nr:methyltransferase domain-containing protein [Campylobacterales bacterium]
ILILASGHGSFDQRLIDLGYTNIYSIDMNDTNKSGVQKDRIFIGDLNKEFSLQVNNGQPYDFIFAIEIIEHLFDHNNFIQECEKLLDKKGTLFISTPNTESTYSKLYYLFKGYMPYFGKEHMPHYGHITPVFKHILENYLSSHNMYLKDISFSDGHYANTLKSKIFKCFSNFLNIFLKNHNEGIDNIFIIRKVN